jgi:hypothetical protein
MPNVACGREIQAGHFEPAKHFYPRALNATIHPMVAFFMRLSRERLVSRYCHLNPLVDPRALSEILAYQPRFFRWAGVDLFNVTSETGHREMVLIETNSCPSGQKSMPLLSDEKEEGGYQILVERVMAPLFRKVRREKGRDNGALAVIYDKNEMEASGYAASLANHFQETVYLSPFKLSDPDPPTRFLDKALEVRNEDGEWIPIRAAFRYVTQKPWERLPLHSKTVILNPVQACLAGGRNKAVAATAYELLNSELAGTGLEILTPETIKEVKKGEIPLLVRRMGGHAVVKIPYSNAGQGVFTITNESELDAFMDRDYEYNQFIVQSLIGNYLWSSHGARGRFYHVGMLPNKKNEIFVADARMMVGAGEDGFFPLAVYGRRAPQPLLSRLDGSMDSWSMLGTNLSIKKGTDTWDSDTGRLILMDRRDFNTLGLSLDDLLKGFIQAVLATVAIDKMAKNLTTQKGRFRLKLYQRLNDDPTLIDEIKRGTPPEA